ncbi:cation:proton antiporter subunit C [Desulfosporosinus shakirovi]|uniref:cation:proton antiporter subunit C n=1 Tax=Desulfosporosinus shakirovi TaxID=2885154 RepID=UPI001E286973|nr:cation:proton antiporter subunit C [Desulfosporosinus sp. SRJS8]MCB8816003.1 cation:proton antiporter subunit C [Desulfosporosinus sp. SRJS8]
MIEILAKYNYWIVIILLCTGLYGIMAKQNLIKKIIALNVFQTSVLLFYVSMSKIEGGTAPILLNHGHGVQPLFDNPLPQVLMLTAIVVGISTTAVALSIVMLIYRQYGTIEEDQILELNKHND